MLSIPYVELYIEKRRSSFYVLVVDREEINEVGPLTRKQALKLHYLIALQGVKSGGKTQRIPKPKIKAAPRKKLPAASEKPVKHYPISTELRQFISQ